MKLGMACTPSRGQARPDVGGTPMNRKVTDHVHVGPLGCSRPRHLAPPRLHVARAQRSRSPDGRQLSLTRLPDSTGQVSRTVQSAGGAAARPLHQGGRGGQSCHQAGGGCSDTRGLELELTGSCAAGPQREVARPSLLGKPMNPGSGRAPAGDPRRGAHR